MLFRHLSDERAGAPGCAPLHVWIRGPQLPEEVEADGLLTVEDHRDLTLDHIARTCEVVMQFQIVKRG